MTTTATTDLSDEQREVFGQITDFLSGDDGNCFYVAGTAGTGKSTLLTALAQAIPRARQVAPTGRAASLLAARSGRPATTIHKLFYRLIDEHHDRQTGRTSPVFRPVLPGSLKDAIVILDEASLVGEDMAIDIFASGCRAIVAGDPAQLGPVVGMRAFVDPAATLRTVHRQALGSGIVRQAHRILTCGRYASDPPDFDFFTKPNDREYCDTDVVLCWRNSTRHHVNHHIRKLTGRCSPYPEAGETVMALRNNYRLGIYNGSTYTLREPYDPDKRELVIDIDGEVTRIQHALFTENDFPDCSKCAAAFDYGYALTVHKAQGSEWKNVIVIDEHTREYEQYASWIYTAVTRAKRRCIVVPRP